MVCIGRLFGPMQFGCFGSRTKLMPRLCSMMPVFSVATPTPKDDEQRIDDRDRVAVAIDDGDQCRIAARRRVPAAAIRGASGRCLSARSAAKLRSSKARHRHAHEGGIGDVGVAHRISEPRGFERDMRALGALRIERGDIEVFEDVEQHKRREPLPVRRQFDNIEAAIIRRDRDRLFAAMRGEIGRSATPPRGATVSPRCPAQSRLS